MHELQRYTPQHDPRISYEIEHNQTDYYVRLDGRLIAAASFPGEPGDDPGWNFTHARAIDVIEAFYRGEHGSIHGFNMVDRCSANSLLWQELRDRLLA